MSTIYNQDADDAFRQALSETRQVVLEAQDLVEVACPHPRDELMELQKRVEATSPLVDVITNEVPLETRLIVE